MSLNLARIICSFFSLPLAMVVASTCFISLAQAETVDHVDKALALESAGNTQAALQEYGKAIRIAPHDFAAFLNRAILKQELGDLSGALADINEALKINMIDATALRTRGDIRADNNDYAGALQDYSESLKWSKRDVITYSNRGITKLEMGDKRSALQDFNQALAIKPDYLVPRCYRLCLLSDEALAKKDYEKLLKIGAKNADDHLALARAHRRFGKNKLALIELNKAIAMHPTFAIAFSNRAVTYELMGDARKALADYNRSIELNPHNAKAYYNRGLLKERLNDREGAMNDLKRALEISPHLITPGSKPKSFDLLISQAYCAG